MRLLSLASLTALAILATKPARALTCWEDAALRYGVSANLLYAIARVESNLDPKAVNRTHIQRTGSYDIGLMQITGGITNPRGSSCPRQSNSLRCCITPR